MPPPDGAWDRPWGSRCYKYVALNAEPEDTRILNRVFEEGSEARVGLAFLSALRGVANPPVTFPHVNIKRHTQFRKSILSHLRTLDLAAAFIFAWSGVALNPPVPYMRTMRFLHLTVRNSVGEHLTTPEKPSGPPALDWRAALERGRVLIRETGLKKGYTVRDEYFMRVLPAYGVYQYDVISSKAPPGAEIQDAGVFIDATTGELRDDWLLSKSPAGTIVTRWLVALHMGTFLGLPMKILIFLSGIITTALSVTGVIIWWKKRDFGI